MHKLVHVGQKGDRVRAPQPSPGVQVRSTDSPGCPLELRPCDREWERRYVEKRQSVAPTSQGKVRHSLLPLPPAMPGAPRWVQFRGLASDSTNSPKPTGASR